MVTKPWHNALGFGNWRIKGYPPQFSADTARVIQVIHETAIGSLKNGVLGCEGKLVVIEFISISFQIAEAFIRCRETCFRIVL